MRGTRWRPWTFPNLFALQTLKLTLLDLKIPKLSPDIVLEKL